MKLTDCRYIKENLLEIVERFAAGDQPDEWAAHLETCRSCRELVHQFAPMFTQLSQEPQEVPETLWRNVQRQVNQYEERKRSSILPSHGWHRAAVISLRSVVIAASVALGVYLGSGIVNGNPTFAEQLADDYSLVLTDLPAGSLSESYLNLQWENGGGSR